MTYSSQPTETEVQLQQELRSLFVVDTQNYLQRYSQVAQHLEAVSWKSDIQELYRCVHTIKGGAVTVAAIAILSVATVLEDLLADLRYLDQAPSLADGYLNQALVEAGELLAGTLELQSDEATKPIVNRIQTLHQEIQERYLAQWNQQRQLHQEFAEQGFDLVVLELEIALERSPQSGTVTDVLVHVAQQTLTQLQQIGHELQFASGWTTLLDQAQTIFTRSENIVWQSFWLQLFQALKSCAKQGGNSVPFEFIEVGFNHEQLTGSHLIQSNLIHTEPTDAELIHSELVDSVQTDQKLTAHQSTDLGDIAEDIDLDSDLDSFGAEADSTELNSTETQPVELNSTEIKSAEAEPDIALAEVADGLEVADELPDLQETFTDISSFLDDLPPLETDFASLAASDSLFSSTDLADAAEQSEALDRTNFQSNPSAFQDDFQAWFEPSLPTESIATSATPATSVQPDSATDQPQSVPLADIALPKHSFDRSPEQVQIPVPLQKLDRSSQHLVETLLSLRTTQGFYQTLQNQIVQLVALAQEGVQYVTHLRQIQDDYALLNDLHGSVQGSSQAPTPERYRQGYTVINRLLETSLRLSEIGAETGKTAQQISENLRNVDTSVLKLQTTVEDSRLISFQNLSFRARAILRDLVTRYGKSARLMVQGEKTELDISTARNLEPILLHLIRNAYDHGLEPAIDRVAQNKPEQGTITLSLQRRGNTFQLELSDDGRGIDPTKIQARAERLGLPITQTHTPADLLAVICQPGFTSETQVSEISGRGVGMDVVAAQTTRLGGRLSLHTVANAGTTFRLQFPVPRLLVSCMLLQAGDQTFAIPLEDIRTTTLLDTLNANRFKDLGQIYSWVIESETGATPALDLLEYWQPRFAGRPLPDTAVCVYVHPPEFQQGIWLLADDLLEQAELIITPLPFPLTAPDGLIGVSLQTNGALVPVLEARTLADRLLLRPLESSTSVPAQPTAADRWETTPTSQTILVVDDAALMRRRLEASLNAYGYTTHTCADGREAWNWLQQNPHPRLIITDIEMPNMDGFTLVDRCRQTGITVPILVISSRLSEEWFDEARRLGASDYLTKGFSTNELLARIDSLLNIQV